MTATDIPVFSPTHCFGLRTRYQNAESAELQTTTGISLAGASKAFQRFCKWHFLLTHFKTLYLGTLKFNIILGATKSAEETTQEELEKACRDGEFYC